MFLVVVRCVKSQNSRTEWGLKFRLVQGKQCTHRAQEERWGQIASVGLIRDEPHLWWQIHKLMGTFSITMCMLGGYEDTNGRKQMSDTSWKELCSHQECVSTLNLTGSWLFLILTSKQWEGEAVSCSDDHPLLQSHWEKGWVYRSCKEDKTRDVQEKGEMGTLGTEGKGEGWSRRMLKQME